MAEPSANGAVIVAGFDSSDNPANLQINHAGDARMARECSVAVVTADGAVKASAGAFYGFFVVASSSGTLALYDHASAASGTKLYDKALSAGDSFLLPVGWKFTNGLYADVGGTSITVNVLYS